MKVKVISRNPDEYLPQCSRDISVVKRNYTPNLHPFQAAREYTRAVSAAKLERVFAKPFLASLDGHKDDIQCLLKHPTKLSVIVSGCSDGEVKFWNLPTRRCTKTIQAHTGFVKGMCFSEDANTLFTVGDDKTIKQWDVENITDGECKNSIVTKTMLTGIAHHRSKPVYATCGEKVDLWDVTRSEPVKSYTWGTDSITTLAFNPIEKNIIGSCANDRGIVFYDIREQAPIRKTILKMCSTKLSWNPMEAFFFTVANDDHSCYTFDMRNTSQAMNVHRGHIAAVLDVDYSPTGKEFVTGSYDKTLRIFDVSGDTFGSRDVYYTKRMQRLKCVLYSLDSKYVMCGSSEMNIRIWKANASDRLGVLTSGQETAKNYSDKLIEKYKHHPEVKKISTKRHVPKHVYNGLNETRIMVASRKRKEQNRINYSRPGAVEKVHVLDEPVVEVKK